VAWYPNAIKMELQPESDAQPEIRPTQLIVHSVVAPWDEKRIYAYWRDSTSLESHFGLDYDGSMGQYIGTETRADANAGANRRADGTGAVSIETASNTKATDSWTDEQVEELIRLGVWLHQRHGIPLRICRNASDPGFGYHSMFREWSTSGTACPGPARITQFRQVVFPGIVARATGKDTTPEENDVALTNADIEKIATAAATKTLTLDGVIDNPNPATAPDNPHISLETAVRNIETVTRRTEKAVTDLPAVELTDAQIATLASAVAADPALAEQIAEKVAVKLAERLAD
jgi:hypothetical protein